MNALKLHPFRERAGNKRGGDDGKHALKDHETRGRDRLIGPEMASDTFQKEMVQSSHESAGCVGSKGQTESVNKPYEGGQPHKKEAVHHSGKHVFRTCQTTVKHGQTRCHY